MKHLGKSAFADAAPLDGQERGRESVSLNARLRVGDAKRATKVRVRSVPAGGLWAEAWRPLAPDAAVEFGLAGIGWVVGRVAWQIEGRVGVALDGEPGPRPLHPVAAGGRFPGRGLSIAPRSPMRRRRCRDPVRR